MDYKQIRVKNLGVLIDMHGRQNVREAVGMDTTQFNQLVSGHGSFGEKVAHRFEKAYDLPFGWMSKPHYGLWADEGQELNPDDVRELVKEARAALDMLPDEIQEKERLKAIQLFSTSGD